MRAKYLLWLCLALVLAVSNLALLYSSFGMSLGAPQLDCKACHSDATSADFALEGLPDTYVPGEEYELVIRILGGPDCFSGMSCGGFAVVADRGKFELVDPDLTQEATVDGLDGVTHTKDGSMAREWHVKWVAPKKEKPVTFLIAVIAANGDGSFTGDAYGYQEITVKPGKPPETTMTTETEVVTTPTEVGETTETTEELTPTIAPTVTETTEVEETTTETTVTPTPTKPAAAWLGTSELMMIIGAIIIVILIVVAIVKFATCR